MSEDDDDDSNVEEKEKGKDEGEMERSDESEKSRKERRGILQPASIHHTSDSYQCAVVPGHPTRHTAPTDHRISVREAAQSHQIVAANRRTRTRTRAG